MRRSERPLLILAAAVSLALTALTIWAVWSQGQALQQRELADLRNAAAQAATQRVAALRSDLLRAFDGAARAWQQGGRVELNAWLMTQPEFLVAALRPPGESVSTLPLTPLESGRPEDAVGGEAPATAESAPAEPVTEEHADVLGSLHEPGARGRALLAVAAVQQNIGQRRNAARTYADAARQLRQAPHFARFAFSADRAAVDCLLAEGDKPAAAQALAALLDGLATMPPGVLGSAEIAELESRLAAVGAAPNMRTRIEQLAAQAHLRDAAARAVVGLIDSVPPLPDGDNDELAFADFHAQRVRFVAAFAPIGPDVRLALVLPLADVLARYWPAETATPWRLLRPADGTTTATAAPPVVLHTLGPAFGGAELVPAEGAARRLVSQSRRQLVFLATTATGVAGAWVVVIWMILRAVSRQRELVNLQRRFVADVSHELKTPLALIRLLAETLRDRRVREPDRIQAYHETITRESERLTVLLDSILDFSRVESGRRHFEFGECDVAAVARQAWVLFEPQFAADGFEARLELAPELPLVHADAQALQQVLVNLLQNAYRYGTQGKFVRLAVAREGFLVVITVEDRGIGMTRSQLDRLGDSFYRADDTRVRHTRGTGLGLAIVNHIVTAHHGKLEVHSRPGLGSTFTVWLPVEPAPT